MGFLEERAGLEGRTAVVIGGAEGLGDASLALAEAGVDIAVCDINPETLQNRTAELEKLGRLRISQVLDARVPSAVERFYLAVDDAVGSIDIVVNVAGGSKRQPFLETSNEDWDRDAEWNLLYVARSCREALARMTGTGGGSIINVTTIEAHRAVPGFAMYGAFKAGVASLTRSLAVEYGQAGVRVNCVAPDFAPTPGLRRRTASWSRPLEASDPDRAAYLMDERTRMYIPLGRKGTPEDISNCVLFLASDLASYVTGQTIHCDGGTWASSGWLNYPTAGFSPMPGEVEANRMFPADG
jgi:3-oxoacyl-[acyl-carrier protein] reductase